jgi:thiosulfate reductase cytochrome b subunit
MPDESKQSESSGQDESEELAAVEAERAADAAVMHALAESLPLGEVVVEVEVVELPDPPDAGDPEPTPWPPGEGPPPGGPPEPQPDALSARAGDPEPTPWPPGEGPPPGGPPEPQPEAASALAGDPEPTPWPPGEGPPPGGPPEPQPEALSARAGDPEPTPWPPGEGPPPGGPPEATALVLERKHPLAIRWMHWVNFPVLFTMIWSGILIYWNDSDNAYRHPHEVYRVGIGSLTLFRFFPEGFYHWLNAPFQVTKGLSYHFFFMWIFAINGIAYVLFLLWSKEWKFMVPTRESLREAIQVTLVDLHLRKGLPAQTKYNGAQRIAYTSVILMGLGSLVTGLAIYKPTQTHWLTTALGGYEMARWLHFMLTIGFCAFFLVHVGQVALAGWNNFRAMVSGYEIRRVDEPSIEGTRRGF